MRIQGSLEWDKHTDDLIGYMKSGNGELNSTASKKPYKAA